MGRPKKAVEETTEPVENTEPIESTEPVVEDTPIIPEPLYVPEVPAQMEEKETKDLESVSLLSQIKQANQEGDKDKFKALVEKFAPHGINLHPEINSNQDEIDFLYVIIDYQRKGGFGRHLEPMIMERIKSLQ